MPGLRNSSGTSEAGATIQPMRILTGSAAAGLQRAPAIERQGKRDAQAKGAHQILPVTFVIAARLAPARTAEKPRRVRLFADHGGVIAPYRIHSQSVIGGVLRRRATRMA